MVLYACVLVWRRPHAVLVNRIQQLAIAVLQMLVAVLQVLSFIQGDSNGDDDPRAVTLSVIIYAIEPLASIRGAYE
jgi:hypothetical protein